jgi:hypothetical protein
MSSSKTSTAGSVVGCGVGDNIRQADSRQHNKREWWTMQDERLADNVGQSGGKQCKAVWHWTTRQEEGGGGHNTGLSGGGRHTERGDGNIIASVDVPLEWKTMRRIRKQGRRV